MTRAPLPVRPGVSGGWFSHPWVLIGLTALIGVPAVILGLSLIALVIAQPITWFLAGAAWFAIGFRHYRHHLTIRDTPMSPIGAAAIGLVEISGRVHAHGPAETAPVSGASCIHWRLTIESRTDNETSTVLDRTSTASSFEVVDTTGRVVVWPWAADVIVTDVCRWEGAAARELGQRLPAGPIREVLTGAGDSDVIVTERKVEIGKTLYIIGVLSERSRVARPTPLGERLRDRFTPDGLRTSLRGADMLKVLVLAVVTVVLGLATGQVIRGGGTASPLEIPPAIDPQQVVIWRGEKERPFIIADSPEGIVVQTLTRWTKRGLFGGAGLMVGTLILYLGGFF